MNTTARTAIVLGGGVLGSAAFRELSRRGIKTQLVDSAAEASSHGSFSWINAAAPTDPAYYQLRLQGMIRHLTYSVPRSLAHVAGVLSWDGEGRVEPVQGATRAESVSDAHHRLVDAGHLSELLDRTAARAIDPSLNPAALPDTEIQYSGDEGWVDLPGLMTCLRRDAVRSGGTIIRGVTGHPSLNPARDHVEHVALSDGRRVSADLVVVASGADTYALLAETGIQIPNRNGVGILVRTQPVDDLAPRAIIRSPHVSVRPETHGSLAFHATSTEAGLTSPEDATTDAIASATHSMLKQVQFLYDSTAIQVRRVDVVRRPVPGDGLPVIGPAEPISNLYVLASHSGASVALILAELLAREVSSGEHSSLLSCFRPERFRTSLQPAD